MFHGESLLQRSPNLLQADLPPGSLVTLLQKALLFLYVETHVSSDGKAIKCDEVFSLLKPHDHEHGAPEADIANDTVDVSIKPPAKKHKAASAQNSNLHNANGNSVNEKSSVPISSPAVEPLRESILETDRISNQGDDPMPERLNADSQEEMKADEESYTSDPKNAREHVSTQEIESNLGSPEQ